MKGKMVQDKPKPASKPKPADEKSQVADGAPKPQAEPQAQSPGQTENPKTSKLGEVESKITELTDLLQHVQADFENYKKRVEKDQENNIRIGKAMVIRRLLPVLDTFEHALAEHKGDTDGLKRIHDQLISALESEGVKPIKSVGDRFNPYRHECVCEECSEQDKGVVIDEIQKGYTLNDYVVRHALVKISKGKAADSKPEPAKPGAAQAQMPKPATKPAKEVKK